MAAIKRSDTLPERKLRSQLHGMGFRFRKDFPIVLEGKRTRPDIAFTRRKVAVFVDGCFWHSCPEHGTQPRRNADYWSPKLQRNVERDHQQTALLENSGWIVLRIWEHQAIEDSATTIAKVLSELDTRPRRA